MAHMADDELEPLITECPSCGTRFRVTEAQLQRARGRVRCGACLTVFDGVEHLTLESARVYADEDQARRDLDDILDELAGGDAGHEDRPDAGGPGPAGAAPAAAPVPGAEPAPFRPRAPLFAGFEDGDGAGAEPDIARTFEIVGEAPSGEPAADAPAPTLEPGSEIAQAGGAAQGAAEAAAGPDAPARESGKTADADTPGSGAGVAAGHDGVLPSGVESDVSAEDAAATTGSGTAGTAPDREPVVFGERPARRPLVWVGIVVGLLLLVAQVLWYRFDDWSTDPQWRPVYASVCRVLGCELPQQQDRSRLATRNLAVRTHPSEPDKLLVNAMIVNEAEFAQPFPVLELRFTTVRGMLVAGRRYEPDEYLAGDAAGLELIPPRTPVQIEVVIDDPGPEAVNYFLRLR